MDWGAHIQDELLLQNVSKCSSKKAAWVGNAKSILWPHERDSVAKNGIIWAKEREGELEIKCLDYKPEKKVHDNTNKWLNT